MSAALGRVSLGESQLISGADILYMPAWCMCVLCLDLQRCLQDQCNTAVLCWFELNLSFSKIAHGSVGSTWLLSPFQKHTNAERSQVVALQDISSSHSAAMCLQDLKDSANN